MLLCGCESNSLVQHTTDRYQGPATSNHYTNTSADISYTSYNGNIYTGPVNNNDLDASYSSANEYITVAPAFQIEGNYYNTSSYLYY